MTILDYAKPVAWRFYSYGTDGGGDPLFSFWAVLDEDTQVCIYDRNGGHGMWLSTDNEDGDHAGETPSDEFEEVLYDVLGTGGSVAAERLEPLPAYERYFFRVIHGTVEQTGSAPAELEAYLSHVAGEDVMVE
ncbi:hypothetical protein [Haloferax sulfurifontis]|uniref:Uncharacterized protein n=2 Tax=Haloferax sulfurifontis TaxID=255616 RepID=M0IIL1_9EURY|nr:hypothetical protein [Haloferax sulfurifontis]ELZ96621.1 hypothetical protein C441_04614 [Haloferax sulfurifontis ATCC BAA-897]GGC72398.1 hypothetical protein GCM10007209_37900 [Haloferax sulfurifontis]